MDLNIDLSSLKDLLKSTGLSETPRSLTLSYGDEVKFKLTIERREPSTKSSTETARAKPASGHLFAVGETVRLRSGGPKMCVAEYLEVPQGEPRIVRCKFYSFDSTRVGGFQSLDFAETMLELVPPAPNKSC